MMGESIEELEPLFDYSRVQRASFVHLDDDDCSDTSPGFSPKRRKLSDTAVEEVTVEDVTEDAKVVHVLDSEDKEEYDWLPPPPKISCNTTVMDEDSTIKELRLKKQQLESFAQQAKEVLRAVEESAKRDLRASVKSASKLADQPSKPPCEREKIIISIQDKGGLKQFRVYKDDKFERLFKMYADKNKLDTRSLVFCFDGDKISPMATPDGLGMEDDDIIEVHIKSS